MDSPRDKSSTDENATRDEKPSKSEEDQPGHGDGESLLATMKEEEIATPSNDEEVMATKLRQEPVTWHNWNRSKEETDKEECSCMPARVICQEQSYQTWQEHIS